MKAAFLPLKKAQVILPKHSGLRKISRIMYLQTETQKKAWSAALPKDSTDEVCVYAKLPKGFAIPTPVGNYSLDWAIAFYEGTVKHIYFIAKTKGTMESLNLRPIEQAKIKCARKLFNQLSTSKVKYHDVDSYQSLLNIMGKL
jgi:restriction endonuclease